MLSCWPWRVHAKPPSQSGCCNPLVPHHSSCLGSEFGLSVPGPSAKQLQQHRHMLSAVCHAARLQGLAPGMPRASSTRCRARAACCTTINASSTSKHRSTKGINRPIKGHTAYCPRAGHRFQNLKILSVHDCVPLADALVHPVLGGPRRSAGQWAHRPTAHRCWAVGAPANGSQVPAMCQSSPSPTDSAGSTLRLL
jgi:hypothetical protein